MAVTLPSVKGAPVIVCANRQTAGLLDAAIDCREANAVTVQVFVNGANPSAVVSLEGSSEQGGNYLPLPDTQASQTLTANDLFDVIVGSRFVKVRLASVTGTYGAGGWTIIVTPYFSPGSARVAASIVVDTLAAIQALTGALTVSGICSIGTDGGIYQGTGTFASPTTGLKVWNDAGVGRIAGYNGGTVQWYASTDGRLYAGAGGAIIDANGFSVLTPAAFNDTRGYRFVDADGEVTGQVGAQLVADGGGNFIRLRALPYTGQYSQALVVADSILGQDASAYLQATANVGDVSAATASVLAYAGTDGVRRVIAQVDWLGVGPNGSTGIAGGGLVRLPNDSWVAARNAADDGDVSIVKVNASDRLELGAALEAVNSGTATGAASGDVKASGRFHTELIEADAVASAATVDSSLVVGTEEVYLVQLQAFSTANAVGDTGVYMVTRKGTGVASTAIVASTAFPVTIETSTYHIRFTAGNNGWYLRATAMRVR